MTDNDWGIVLDRIPDEELANLSNDEIPEISTDQLLELGQQVEEEQISGHPAFSAVVPPDDE